MAQDQTVVDHLLLGRQALLDDVGQAHAEVERLQAELNRLTAAIEQLDSVIAMIGSGATPPPPTRSASSDRTETGSTAAPVRTARTSAPSKRAVTRARKPGGQAPKSIRVHVLEMLAAEDRDWSLAEIIDRIHDAGIQAHDDAVRSITIKLMKDGRVERVGRGQYRLAARGSSRPTVSTSTPPPAQSPAPDEAVTDSAPEPDPATVADTAPAADDHPTTPGAETVSTQLEASGGQSGSVGSDRPYTPPLNLGQPWG